VFAPPQLIGMTVLLIARTAIAAGLAARQLSEWGAQTDLVADEQTAIARVREGRWDALIVDYALGMPACMRIAHACGKTVARLIVLISPLARPELPALRQAGFAGYLIKPVRAESLARQIGANDQGGERQQTLADQRNALAQRTSQPLSILVAEDNEINALLANVLLSRLGHEITLVTTGSAAVETWHAAVNAGRQFDLILMDVQMPDGGGIEVAQWIRAMEAEQGLAPVPLYTLTANAFEEDRRACLAAGMNGILIKPLDRARIVEILASISRTSNLAA
jgi:CheY-like chemotaxis protein